MLKPDYENSIVNLMSSLFRACGVKTPYKPLPLATIKHKHIVLFVIDGLGYEYLRKQKDSFIGMHVKRKMTSAFPSTTAVCVTAFATGLPAQQSGVVGWFTHYRELGMIFTPLRYEPRFGGTVHTQPEHLFPKPILAKLKRKVTVIVPTKFQHAPYSNHMNKGVRVVLYKTLRQCTAAIAAATKQKRSSYSYAYWGDFDTYCHHDGPGSKRTLNHFKEIDAAIEKLSRSIAGTDTALVITADHGLTSTPRCLNAEEKLKDYLVMPFSGEQRAAYCYVKQAMAKQFVKKAKQIGCTPIKSETLLQRGYFGLGKEHPELRYRIGDYVLFPPSGASLFKKNLGSHGGLSKEELFVPLIIIESTTAP